MTAANRIAILRALDDGRRAVRLGLYMWRWKKGDPGASPPLINEDTSALMRADLVEEIDSEMVLTTTGRIHLSHQEQ